ncbi:glutathione S-transferase [Mycena galopus ATCC 62051]|nr:glutathione S-transferase [Mycena galopus ATCC 62051]
MVLKLYALTFPAGGTAIVALALWEKQIPFEFVPISLDAKDHKTPQYLAKNPFGQVPVIEDDGFIVYESRAICRYLADKYPDQGTDLLPKGLKERSMVEQVASVESATFHPAVMAIVEEAVMKPSRGLAIDQAVLDQALIEFKEKLAVYDAILGENKFLAGEEFSLADLSHYSYAPFLADAGVDVMTSQGLNVTRWWNELMSRHTWVKLKSEGLQSKSSY